MEHALLGARRLVPIPPMTISFSSRMSSSISNLRCDRSIDSIEFRIGDMIMPRGDKSKYTDKQKRKAEHIAESYEERGVPADEAKSRGWATVNRESGGGNESGSGRGRPDTHVSSRKGGKKGGAAAARSPAERSESARKAAATRKRNRDRKAGT
jgi:plasmid stabilization system protein ParE